MADPDPMTCDVGSRVYDPDPGTVVPDPIYLVTTLIIPQALILTFPAWDWVLVYRLTKIA